METQNKELLVPQEVSLTEINGGYAFQNGDVLTADTLNKSLSSLGFVQGVVQGLKSQPDISEINNVGTPEISILPDGRFKFKNLKGEKGVGTAVSVGGQSAATVSFDSNPQEQLNRKATIIDGAGNVTTNFDTRAVQSQMKVGALNGNGFYTFNLVCPPTTASNVAKNFVDLGINASQAVSGTVMVTCGNKNNISTVKLLNFDANSSQKGNYLHIHNPEIVDDGYRIGNIETVGDGNYGFVLETTKAIASSETSIQILITSSVSGWNPSVSNGGAATFSLPRPMYTGSAVKIYDKDIASLNWGFPNGLSPRIKYDKQNFKEFDYLTVNIAGNLSLHCRSLMINIDLLNLDSSNRLYINSMAGILELNSKFGLTAVECYVNETKDTFCFNNAIRTGFSSIEWINFNEGDSVVTTIFGGKY